MDLRLSRTGTERGAVHSIRGVLALTMVVGFAACTTRTVTTSDGFGLEPQRSPLIVARSGDWALLSWQSVVGEEYTVLYTDGSRHQAEWRPLEGVSGIRGTGQEMRFQDRMPQGVPRHYRLMITESRER